MNLMLVRKRTEINCEYENESQVETEQQENPINGIQLEALKESVEKDEDQELPVQIKTGDKELERLVTHELQHIDHCNMAELEPRENYINLDFQKISRTVQTGL